MIGQLLLGARLAFAGGRNGLTRTAMSAVGVGLGLAILLAATAMPAMLQSRADRGAARTDQRFGAPEPARGDGTLLVGTADTMFRDEPIRGRLLRPEGPRAPIPPGLSALPKAGEMAVSPALADLLSTSDGALLAERFDARVVATIADEGLTGPREYVFYLGNDSIDPELNPAVRRIDHFGEARQGQPPHPMLLLLVVIGFAILLLPVAVFVGAAIRFGGEQRDRRLAALRLVGADRRMVRRIAAGEALLSVLAGLAAGAVFFLVGRQFVPLFTLWDLSVFVADVRPDPLLASLVLLAVPVLAVAVALVALRGITIEPLGVVRRSGPVRRRVWWRLVPPVLALVVLYPLSGAVATHGGTFNEYQVAAGVVLLLLTVTALLPWLVEAVVRRLGGGSVSWQLAVRRLQLDSGTAARQVSGIAVAVAGAIALQAFFAGVHGNFTGSTGNDPARAQLVARYQADYGESTQTTARFAAVPGVRAVYAVTATTALLPASAADGKPTFAEMLVGDCAALAELALIDGCVEGDTFLLDRPVQHSDSGGAPLPVPGQRVGVGSAGPQSSNPPQWTVPLTTRTVQARPDPVGIPHEGLLVTPAALGGIDLRKVSEFRYLRTDPGDPDAFERVRNAAAAVDPLLAVDVLRPDFTDPRFADIRRGLFIGVLATLLLIGASLLVTTLEQLRERRRVLSVLVAFGTRRSTIARSILWQSAVPMMLGLVLAVAVGTGLAAILLSIVTQPIRFDWASVATFCAAGGAVVLLVTALSLPALNRLMRTEGLRTE